MPERVPNPATDALSRTALRQIWVLLAASTAGFAGLMLALSWAASLTGAGAATVGAIDVAANTISITLAQEPPQLDSTRATDSVSIQMLNHLMEGLLRYGPDGRLAPGVAERWEIRPEGATFWLRRDAYWSDGMPVTAQDFVYAWQTVVDPANASQYAYIFYVIRNAEAINTRRLEPSALGVRAVSDYELQVEFENPVAYFDKLVAFPTYLPVRRDFHLSRAGRYGADVEDLLYNGPFTLTRWVHGANLRLEKNPTYWNREAVKLAAIEVPYITTDGMAVLNLYRDGQIADVVGLGSDTLDQVLRERWPLGRFSDGSVWFLLLNHRPGHTTANWDFRRALQLVNDNAELLYSVIKVPSYALADSLFPSWLRGERRLFKQEYPPPRIERNLPLAREHLERARQALGIERLPPLVILVDDTPGGSKMAEYLQNLYMRTLGLEIRIDKQIFKQRLAKAEAGEFDIVLYGWGPDYDDPLTFADLFASWSLNNHGHYRNPELDAQVRIAQRSIDPRERMAAFGEIQRLLIEDVVIIPNYERGQMFIRDPRLKGVVHNAIGAESDYTNAYIVPNP
jgi:oligopeptide transport system substrate-binding protein